VVPTANFSAEHVARAPKYGGPSGRDVTLIERDRELRAVAVLLAGARDGRGATLLVEGLPGIGKTALLAAARAHADAEGFRTLSAVGGELDRELPFAIVRQLLEPPLLAASPDSRADLLEGAAGLAVPVFGLGEDQFGGTDPSIMGSVIHGLYWMCSNLAEAAPLLLAVDDVHWADDASLRFLSHLARRIADLPALLIVAGRPGAMLDSFVSRALSGLQPRILHLKPLSDDAVGLLVRKELSADAEDEFCHACARASGGNPFLLAEALTSLRADGVRPVAAEAWQVENLRPDTIARAVLTRIARLGPEASKLVRAIAVLDPITELRQVAQLANLAVGRAAELVDALAREAIITSSRPITFAHPLMRTAVYMDSSEVLRAADHKRAAVVLAADGVSAEQLARHLLLAEPDSDPWVVETLSAAATSALARGAPEPAAAYLKRALAEPPVLAGRGPLFAAMGRALGMANRPDEATPALRNAIELAQEPHQRAELTLELAWLMVQVGRGQDSIELLKMALRSIDRRDPKLPLQLHAALAVARLLAMEPPTTWMDNLERVSGGETDRLVLSILAFGACVTGDRTASETARLAELAAAGPLPGRDKWILVNMASAALGVADRLPAALDLLDRGIETTRRLGDTPAFRYLAMLRSHTALYAGRLLEAEADGRAALEMPLETSPPDTPLAAAVLIDALLDRGLVAEAQRVLAENRLEGEQSFDLLIAHFVFMARGRLRRHQHRAREALVDLRRCGETLTGAGYTNPAFAHWRAEAALAHLSLGENAVAAELAAEDLHDARKFQAPRAIGIALRIAGLSEGGRQGLALLEESTATLACSSADLEHARALIDYGAALRRAGHRKQAHHPLRQGLDLAARCGARDLANRAGQELISAGARPRREKLSGPESLTASELRIARLAAHGATNREIAQTLFLSRRTIEVHLTNTYRKLNIDSRHDLRSALAERLT
jgi:DNA-binding CsgD family transcriptional regulator